MSVKLNIGSGQTQLEGWIPIDRKLGLEAYPLPGEVANGSGSVKLTDNSVDEIRASHILEHFSFRDAEKALADWVRVLKPGGRIKIAVPDIDAVAKCEDGKRLFYLMGGQTDADDFHKSAYDVDRLRSLMQSVGLAQIQRWESANTDCASLPISLNLEGVKQDRALAVETREQAVRVRAFMTVPRYVAAAARAIIDAALKPLNITLVQADGVFYGQCMQRMFEEAVADDLDWILTLDSDSIMSSGHVSALFDEFARHPEVDALAALQCRRGRPFPLMTVPEASQNKQIGIGPELKPILVATAHFGLTLIRVADLKEVEKPWFKSQPDKAGGWGDDRLDDDIWFWHQWRLAGKSIYVTPKVSIGHLEEVVTVFDEELQPQHLYLTDWRKKYLDPRHTLQGTKDA